MAETTKGVTRSNNRNHYCNNPHVKGAARDAEFELGLTECANGKRRSNKRNLRFFYTRVRVDKEQREWLLNLSSSV
ncbi:hypothetical protein TNCV_620341 [Trichonephila clavipes]|nr:hypothetical protein TNCV_620341 [Trichonephila clavipes]